LTEINGLFLLINRLIILLISATLILGFGVLMSLVPSYYCGALEVNQLLFTHAVLIVFSKYTWSSHLWIILIHGF